MEFNDVQLRYESSREEIDAAIRGVLSSGRYILGPAVQRFEEQFAAYCRAHEGIGVASGTSALSIGLRAIGVRAGDEVLVPAISAAATAMAVTAVGAKPVFVDVSPDDFNNSRLDELHAAILQVQLRKLDDWNRRRRKIAVRYREELRELPVGVQVETGKSNYHLFVITTPHRDQLRAYLSENGIPTLIHYPV